MRLTIIYIFLLFSIQNGCCASIAVEHEIELFVCSLTLIEDDSYHKHISDSIDADFRLALKRLVKNNATLPEDGNINLMLKRFYNNATKDYDDSRDLRRMKKRRSLIFATLAFHVNDYPLAMSFMDYAKKELFVWYKENNKPEIVEFLEPSYLGLLFSEILIKNHYGYKIVENDLNELNAFLSSYEGNENMSKYIDDANRIILKIKGSDLYE